MIVTFSVDVSALVLTTMVAMMASIVTAAVPTYPGVGCVRTP